MKKNVMMRIACFLLVAVLISTSTISGTYAKYVTDATGNDVARVADWGVTATVTGGAFKTQYERTDTSYDVTAYTVVSSTAAKLVAPGTNGTFGGVALTGSPEVAVRVDYTGTEVQINGWLLKDGTTFYCPLQFNINGTVINGLDYNNEGDLETALYNAIVKGAGDYQPNTDLATIDDLNGEYTWAWPFDSTSANYIAGQTDIKDTELGDLEAADPAVDANLISINVKVTVTQID